MGALSGLSGLGALSGLMPEQPPMTIHNTITIDWTGNPLPVNRNAYGINAYQALNPTVTATQAYKNAIEYLNPSIVRIHSLEMLRDSTTRPAGWVKNPTQQNYQWDAAKITSALTGLAPGRPKLLTICRFPAVLMDASGKLLAGKTQEFANFCLQLVTIATQANPEITHISLLNELDTVYSGATNMQALGVIWNACRDAIKAVYPNLAIGGHAFANVWSSTNVDAYLSVTKAKLDFFTFNAYTTGNPQNYAMQQLWNSAVNSMRDSCQQAKNRLQAAGVPNIPIWATEMGMLTLSSANPLAIGSKRMVWEALRMIRTANSAAAAALLWNEWDDWHGAFSNAGQPRPTAHVYKLFNQKMLGFLFPLAVTGETMPVPNSTPVQGVYAMATQDQGKKAIALVNRSELPRNIRIQHNGWVPNPSVILDVNLITGNGIQTAAIPYEDFASGYSMPIDSVAVVSIN